MDVADHVGLASRPGSGALSGPGSGAKKMKKRKELDALVAGTRGNSVPPTAPGAKLLSNTSDEEDSSCGGTAQKRRNNMAASRRLRMRRRTCAVVLRVCTALLALACVVAAAAVMWLFVDVREQIAVLRKEVDQVVDGSQNVPDHLQRMHSLTRYLQANQSMLNDSLTSLTAQLANLTLVVSGVQDKLREVQRKITDAPELVNLPQEVSSMSTSVAKWGSQIQDLISTVDNLKQNDATLSLNITSLEQRVLDLSKIPTSPPPVATLDNGTLTALRVDTANALASVNSTLSSRLKWLEDEHHKDTLKMVQYEESALNASARIGNLEAKCERVETQDALNQTIRGLTSRLELVQNSVVELQRSRTTVAPSPAASVATLRSLPRTSSIVPVLVQTPPPPLMDGLPPVPTSEAASAPSETNWPTNPTGH